MATETEPAKKVWTTDDLLAMPDDGVERWIINGELREKPSEFPEVGMTVRNRHHAELIISIGGEIRNWARSRPGPRGKVSGGDAGVRLPGAETTIGADVVYAPPEVVTVQDDDESTVLVGVPTLVVEVLSPNDVLDQTEEKIETYLDAGVPLVWVVNPYRRTIIAHRPGAEPELYNATHRVPEHPAMPGFTPAVAELFE